MPSHAFSSVLYMHCMNSCMQGKNRETHAVCQRWSTVYLHTRELCMYICCEMWRSRCVWRPTSWPFHGTRSHSTSNVTMDWSVPDLLENKFWQNFVIYNEPGTQKLTYNVHTHACMHTCACVCAQVNTNTQTHTHTDTHHWAVIYTIAHCTKGGSLQPC